jgi:hypothetical protein
MERDALDFFAGETPAVVRPLGRFVSTGEDCAM